MEFGRERSVGDGDEGSTVESWSFLEFFEELEKGRERERRRFSVLALGVSSM